ncbi:hypothetical protein K1T71_012005 [Dendrolimus kikuchii]|uniref:Uncharacterized protein n=1 Tax=Dendrolimus kikuchii TaxID=765133 RepID=A0ACC1CKL6_9NEOP|nr:hypothetical protein K1T71_012005 [Dendrolimus kikuchii]
MSLELQPYRYDVSRLEQLLLQIGDAFNIRIVWDNETAAWTGALALAGGIIGGYAGGRMGAALGAGIATATGLTVSTVISLRELWATIKEKLKGILFIILNHLRRLDASDYIRAIDILMARTASRRELAMTIIHFIADKLGREVLSSVTVA